jgi:hypothetical protein
VLGGARRKFDESKRYEEGRGLTDNAELRPFVTCQGRLVRLSGKHEGLI